jgi:hypothetical protein
VSNKVHKSFFIPTTSVVEAYRDWKSYWGRSAPTGASGSEGCIFQETPSGGLHWSTHWGLTRIEGEADFIPARGGCVLYLSLNGAGAFSRLLLAAPSPLSRQLWRSVDRFRLAPANADID